MKVVTTEELINIDKKTTEKIPSILLMEHVALDIFNLFNLLFGNLTFFSGA